MLWSGVIDRCSDPGLAGLLQAPAGIGLLERLARQDPEAAVQMCRQAEEVLRQLPAGGIAPAQLAADVLGDAHALDDGGGTATLVLAALRLAASPVADEGHDSPPQANDMAHAEAAGSAERPRDIWARAGVLVNELARPALFGANRSRGSRR